MLTLLCLQSPFTGRHEPINPEQPVLYARYTPVDGALKVRLFTGSVEGP